MVRCLLAFAVLLAVTRVVAADKTTAPVTVTASAIVLGQPIDFETANAVIKKESFPLLDTIAATLAAEKKIAFVEIQVHTDERGNDSWNLAISQKRADAIRDYLVAKGIDSTRLRAKGYGESRPLDPHHDAKAWAKN